MATKKSYERNIYTSLSLGIFRLFFILVLLYCVFNPRVVYGQTGADWYMSGANPQRTSWVSTELTGSLKVEWYLPIEPYIPPYVQVIAANDTLYLSTARGLYSFDSITGWIVTFGIGTIDGIIVG